MAKPCWTHECIDPKINATPVIPAHVVAPWVRCKFLGSDFEITVGNETSKKKGDVPMDNLSCIKSFQYGFSSGTQSGGFEAIFEIEDAQGGEFDRFLTKVYPKNSDKGQLSAEFKMEFQFGWTFRDCDMSIDGTMQQIKMKHSIKPSQYVSLEKYGTPTLVETNYDANKVKFNITCTAPINQLVNTNSERKSYGYDGGPIRLKIAIKQIFAEHGIMPLFLRKVSSKHLDWKVKNRLRGLNPLSPDDGIIPTPNSKDTISLTDDEIKEFEKAVTGGLDMGSVQEWGFHARFGGFYGPLCSWKTNNRDPVEAVMEWLHTTITDLERGIVMGVYNGIPGKPIVIFWESPLPDCNGKFPFQQGPLGYYIVNGGKCSPVISFKPNIKWHSADMQKGGTSSNMSAHMEEAADQCDLSGEGTPSGNQVPKWAEEWFHGSAAAEMTRAYAANQRANVSGFQAIEAELVCQGDPRMDDLMFVMARRIGLVVINPYALMGDPNRKGPFADCGFFGHLSGKPVNDFFTHDAWMIQGVDHQIKEGSFTTAYKIFAPIPGKTINRKAPFGEACSVILEKT